MANVDGKIILSSTDPAVLEWVKQAFGFDPVKDEWSRIIIDMKPGEVVKVFIEKPGTGKMLSGMPDFSKAEITVV